MPKFFRAAILFLLIGSTIEAQELNCDVTVNLTTNTTSINKSIFKSMEQSMSNFMNSRKWTDKNFTQDQKIQCNLIVNITTAADNNIYVADFTIQSKRPIYNTTYFSPIIRHKDKAVPFEFIENQPMDFGENIYSSNLTSALAFYAYLIIALDYESFSEKGGQPFIEKCQLICSNVPTNLSIGGNVVKGWQVADAQSISGKQTRIGIVLDYMSARSDKFRKAFYEYHIKGLDMMADNSKQAMDGIGQAIADMSTNNNGNYIIKHFVSTKIDEIVNLYSTTPSAIKAPIGTMLVGIEPIVTDKVNKNMK